MKFFTNKGVTKKIILLLITIIIFNVLAPIYHVSADADESFAGKLFRPILQFFAGVGDLCIRGLQKMFIGNGDITQNSDVYSIRYGPAAIFSNIIPGLDANFINPKYTKDNPYQVMGLDEYVENEKLTAFSSYESIEDAVDDIIYESSGSSNLLEDNEDEKSKVRITLIAEDMRGIVRVYYQQNCLELETIYDAELSPSLMIIKLQINNNSTEKTYSYSELMELLDNNEDGKNAVNKVIQEAGDTRYLSLNSAVTGDTKVSTSYALRDRISTWYKGLRAVALVGLLSVLVYIGIRIIISSTGQEKAKYKKMIGDWIVAICILFVLHYIMAFTMMIVEEITGIFQVNTVGPNGEDVLMTNLRNNINSDQYSSLDTFVNLILYLVLVVYTILFTVSYLKRLIYLAFFTMIAPLIALTYPLDKIKDGQAQAFTMWIREYVFNALIPVIHIVIYSIFVGSAIDFAVENPIYAIVCIGFLTQAEKFFKKMFGFDKATTTGQLGAAAGGALVMNAINKMGHRSGKQAAAKAGGSSGGGASNSTPRYIASPGGAQTGGAQTGGTQSGGIQSGGTQSGGASAGGASVGGIGAGGTAFGTAVDSAQYATNSSRRRGLSAMARGNINKKTIKNGAKSLGRMTRKVGIGALGAGVAGTIGLAAGIATGDPSNALKYAGTGALAGYWGANNVGDAVTGKVGNVISKNMDLYREGKWGTDEFNTSNSVNKLKSDTDFNQVCRDLGVKREDREALIRKFHSNGITDPEDIKRAMNAGAGTSNRNTNEIIAAAKIRQEAKRYGMKAKDIRQSLASKGVTGTDLDRAMDLIDLL